MSRINLILFVLTVTAFALSLVGGPGVAAAGEILSGQPMASLIVHDIRLPRTGWRCWWGARWTVGAVLRADGNPLASPACWCLSGARWGRCWRSISAVTGISTVAGPSWDCGRAWGVLVDLCAGAGRHHRAHSGGGGGLQPRRCPASPALNFAPILMPPMNHELLLGSLATKWTQVWLIVPFVALGAARWRPPAAPWMRVTGRSASESLGVDLNQLRLTTSFSVPALAVGAATSVTGAIGFIGLVGAAIWRGLCRLCAQPVAIALGLGGLAASGRRHRGRTVHLGPELKLGVFTSLIGTPSSSGWWVRLRKVAP